jgi:membrane-bound serine protease (ClpP class)
MSWRTLLLLLTSVSWCAPMSLSAQDEPADPADKVDAESSEQAPADNEPPEKTEHGPVARYVTVTNPVDNVIFSRVRNILVKLQHQAEQEDRAAILILEIERGTSMFGQVRDLAKELTSARYSMVRTIAWVPDHEDNRPLDGYTAILALACKEIVMHPDAEIGDIGRGQPIDDDEQHFVINMVEKRYNTQVNGALVVGMCDPQKTILRIKIDGGDGVVESRVVTGEELRRLQDNDEAIPDIITIKEQGQPLLLSGRSARAYDVLAMQTSEDRSDLADLYGFERRYLREDLTGGEAPKARLIKVEGAIGDVLEEFVKREIRRAVTEGANLIIFEIDSPGGELYASQAIANAIAELNPKECRSVAYVANQAISGGAMIAFGCDEIIMHPDARIGDIIPLAMQPGGWAEHAPEKVLSILRDMLNELAERKSRPPALLEAMADKDLVVYRVTHRQTGRGSYMSTEELESVAGEWEKGPIVPETREGVALTVTGQRAFELELGEEPVSDFDELKNRLAIPQDQVIKAAEQTWVDTLVAVLKSPAATVLLFLVGFVCIYLEVYTMTGFFGIGAGLCFAVFFWSRFLGGTAIWLEVVLFLVGLTLIAIEIFVIPGFGVFGLTGGLAVLFSLILASQTFVIPSTDMELEELSWTMGTLSGSIVAMVVVGVVLSRVMPHMPGIRNLILGPASLEEGPRLNPQLAGEASATAIIEQDHALLNRQGTAFSTLRPSGKAQIEGRLVDVVTDGEFLDAGTPIEVVQVAGNRVVVRSVS